MSGNLLTARTTSSQPRAPLKLLQICHFEEGGKRDLSTCVNSMAEEGLRVIGVAKAEFKEGQLPHGQHDFKFTFLGLIGFADPVRAGVASAIRECYAAGIRVIMITGDYPATALNIASQIGLKQSGTMITGNDLT